MCTQHARFHTNPVDRPTANAPIFRYLTDSGIEYLRVYLNLPSEIVPATLKKSAQPSRPAFGGRPEGGAPRDGARAGGYGDRDGYRGGGGGFGRGGDKGGAPGAYQPRFGGEGGAGGGFGRGRA